MTPLDNKQLMRVEAVESQELALPRGYRVPMRRGSEYTDDLLRRVIATLPEDCATIGVASGRPEAAVATNAINLATRAADHLLTPTLLIDADVVGTGVTRNFRCKKPGLAECICEDRPVEECVRGTKVSGLSVMGIGDRRLAKDMSLHHGILAELRQDYRCVIFSLPPVTIPSHLDAFMGHLDGMILVAKYGDRKSHLANLRSHVRSAGSDVLALVMTGQSSSIPGWLRRMF